MPSNNVRSVHLPYCVKKLEDGRYVVLNRDYKPLGFRTKEHVDYAAYPIAFKARGLTKTVAAKISWESSEDLDNIFLYNDGCVPTTSAANMTAYLERLHALAKVEIPS